MLGNKLLIEGVKAFSDLQRTGINIDTDYIVKERKKLGRKIKKLEKKILTCDIGRKWKEVYGNKLTLNSGSQLGDIIFNYFDYKPSKKTAKGTPSTDRESLEKLNIPIMEQLIERTKLQDCRNKFLGNIFREQVNGTLHPNFNLHNVITYRSSSSDPNFQNFPNRDAVMQKIVRSCIVPRPGRRLGEFDYSGVEVGIGCCYHKDPVMMEYVNNPEKDMHRDMAGEIYILTPKEVSKMARFSAKSGFVFSQFYGSWWKECAIALWNNISELNLEVDGVKLDKHLKKHGINELGKIDKGGSPSKGSFYEHIKNIEDDFWNRRFKIYGQWKKDWWAKYQKKGFFKSLTGFKYQGVMSKNDVTNYPVQGSAFHCLLWAVITLNKELREQGFKTRIIGQIHDSCISDIVDEELQDFLTLAKKIMTEEIYNTYDWINVQLEAEYEVTPIDGSWCEKEEWVEKDGIWIKK